MKILGIGITGLVGSRIVEVLQDKYEFQNLSLETGVNITDPSTLDILREADSGDVVLQLAAKADVDGCEADREAGEEGAAYKINVQGTQNIVDACKISGKKLIYISTDFVFDGENPPEGGYTEDDTPHPTNWYAETKYKGEEIVRNSGLAYNIVRIAYPYRDDSFAMKKDFVHAIAGRLIDGKPIVGVTDHFMTPTHIDDIALAINAIIHKNENGTYHVVGSQSLTPHEAAVLIAAHFNCDTGLISKTTREAYFAGKAARPFNLSLNNDKIKKLSVTMRSFTDGIKTSKA